MLVLWLAQTSFAVDVLVPSDGSLFAQPCDGSGCWTNYLRADDLDGDGDLDLVFANYAGLLEEGTAQPLAVYRNDGTGVFSIVSGTAVGGFEGRVRQFALGDVDGNGAPDLFVPDGAGAPMVLFMNDGSGIFTDEAATRLPALDLRAGAARMGDLDGDGDLDLIVADGYAEGLELTAVAHLLLNDGTGVFTDASDQLPDTWSGIDPVDIDLLDADRDFDLDILINPVRGDLTLWLNEGAGTFVHAPTQIDRQRLGFHFNPAVCDVDNDGDLDIWLDDMGPGNTEQLLINDGTGRFVEETEYRVLGNPSDDDNGVACADLDHDGDYEAVIWSLGQRERVLLNAGYGNFTLSPDGFQSVPDLTLWGDFGDLDGDGILDAVTGQNDQLDDLNRVYRGTAPAIPDQLPPLVTHVQLPPDLVSPRTPQWLRFAVRDATVTDSGPRLARAFARGNFGSGIEDRPARFVGGDLYAYEVPGIEPGATLDLAFCAEDRAGNIGCGDLFPITAETLPKPTGDTGGPTGDTGFAPIGDTSPPPNISLPGPRCGCSSPGAVPVAWLGGLLAFGLRRRQRPADVRNATS